jgi:3-deoxy-D-manno-octulosonic-acid transferase
MWGSVANTLYSTLLILLTPVYLVRLWWRGRSEPRYRRGLRERLGLYRQAPPVPATVWLHAVSLGETHAAAPLVNALRAQQPGLRLLLTCGTATGWEAGKPLLRAGDQHAWLPFDTPGAVRRFLRHYRPSVGVLMETEVWPNLMRRAARERVPVVLANARLSSRSLKRGQRLGALMRPAVQRLSRVFAQSVDDAQRLVEIGAPRVEVYGNLKFDMTPAPKLLARGLQWRQALQRPVVLAASTREGEERLLLDAWRALPKPRPLLLLVPRHPQRFEEVAGSIRAHGFSAVRRSEWQEQPPEPAQHVDVWLGDSMGEMPTYYAASDVALLGGSFEPLGGQNLIEAAACGCPVVMGPHTFNFADAAELSLAAQASMRVPDIEQGVQRAAQLAIDPARNAWVERAFDFATAHRGATQRTATAVIALAEPQP